MEQIHRTRTCTGWAEQPRHFSPIPGSLPGQKASSSSASSQDQHRPPVSSGSQSFRSACCSVRTAPSQTQVSRARGSATPEARGVCPSSPTTGMRRGRSIACSLGAGSHAVHHRVPILDTGRHPYNSGVGETQNEVGCGGLQTGILTTFPRRWVSSHCCTSSRHRPLPCSQGHSPASLQ